MPWKLSGRKTYDGRHYAFESKLRAHFAPQGNKWKLRLMRCNFAVSRAVVIKIQDDVIPVLVELTAESSQGERFDARHLHLIRVHQWPPYINEAVNVNMRAVFSRGRWEPMVTGEGRGLE